MRITHDVIELKCDHCGFYMKYQASHYEMKQVNEMHKEWHTFAQTIHDKESK